MTPPPDLSRLFPHVKRDRKGGVEYHSIRGRPRSTFWRTGDCPEGGPEYQERYRAAIEPPRPAGTFRQVIDDYLRSRAFRDLAPRTRADYLRIIDQKIGPKFGDAPMGAFDRPGIRRIALAWRDGIASPRQAQYAWQVLRLLVNHAVDREMIDRNRLTGGGSVYSAERADVIWTEADLSEMERVAPAYVWRPLRFMAESGLRPGDLIRLTRGHITAGRVTIRTGKTGRIAAPVVTPLMTAIIEATPPDRLLLFTNAEGQPWTEQALSKRVLHWRREAKLSGKLRLYDARGSAVTRQVAAGQSLGDLALMFGWSPGTAAQMLQTYAHLDPAMTDRVLGKLAGIGGGTGTEPVETAVESPRAPGGDGA